MVTLRATPNLNNWRPADVVETAVGWKEAITSLKTPHSLILSRQNLKNVKYRFWLQKRGQNTNGHWLRIRDPQLVYEAGSQVGICENQWT
mgnify:CR=1 FL=1